MPTTEPSRYLRSPLQSAAAHRVLVVVLSLLGLALGIGASVLTPTTYTAQARVAVAPDSNNAYAIAGFPLAARDLAANYARWVQNNAKDGTWASAGVSSVAATPVPESGVISITTTADGAEAATAGAQHVADELAKAASVAQEGQDPQKAFTEFQELAPKVAAAQTAVDTAQTAYSSAVGAGSSSRIATTSATLEKQRVALAELRLRQDAIGERYKRLVSDIQGISQLRVIAPAASTGDSSASRMQRWGLLGLGAGLLAGLTLASLRDRRTARRDAVTE